MATVTLGKAFNDLFQTLALIERTSHILAATGTADDAQIAALNSALAKEIEVGNGLINYLMSNPVDADRNMIIASATSRTISDALLETQEYVARADAARRSAPTGRAFGQTTPVPAPAAGAAATWLARLLAAQGFKQVGLEVAKGLGFAFVVGASVTGGVLATVFLYRHITDPGGVQRAWNVATEDQRRCDELRAAAAGDTQKLARAEALCRRMKAMVDQYFENVSGDTSCGLLDTPAPLAVGLILGAVLSYKWTGDLLR